MNTPLTNATPPGSMWTKRLIVSLTILIWVLMALLFLWLLGQVIGAVIAFALAVLIAYALFPLVKLFQRVMPWTMAILLVAAPLSGFIQELLIVGWQSWRNNHPEQFEAREAPDNVVARPGSSITNQ